VTREREDMKWWKIKGSDVRIATYNIRNRRVGNLEIALRAVAQVNVNITIITEVKLTDERFPRISRDRDEG
jgi:hypothetical protein